MHGNGVSQAAGGPSGAVAIAADGSIAALVPARRALSWQLTDDAGAGIVRERNWLSFQPGEIRVCTSCHGINKLSQTGAAEPTNEPEALRDLLIQWKQGGATPGGPTATPTPIRTPTRTATPAGPIATATPTPGGEPGGTCESGVAIDKARLRATTSTGSIKLTGRVLMPQAWSAIVPQTDGVRVVIDGVLDVTIPGGAGWTANPNGKRWRFDDEAGSFGGVRRVTLATRATPAGVRITFDVRFVAAPQLPALGPLDATIHLDDADQCATAHWNGPTALKPRCQGSAARLNCG